MGGVDETSEEVQSVAGLAHATGRGGSEGEGEGLGRGDIARNTEQEAKGKFVHLVGVDVACELRGHIRTDGIDNKAKGARNLLRVGAARRRTDWRGGGFSRRERPSTGRGVVGTVEEK